MSAARVVCPGCRTWTVDYDIADLDRHLNGGIRVVNGLVDRIPPATVVDIVLLDHIAECPPVQAWLTARRRNWKGVIARFHPLAARRSTIGARS